MHAIGEAPWKRGDAGGRLRREARTRVRSCRLAPVHHQRRARRRSGWTSCGRQSRCMPSTFSRCSGLEPAAATRAHVSCARDGTRAQSCRVLGSRASFKPTPGWLLFVTHDLPFEERLDILLLNRSHAVLDQAWLSWIYATGAFRNVKIQSHCSIVFDFFSDHSWRVTVLERPQFRLPFIGEPTGAHRGLRFRRHFVIGRAARP